MAIVASFDILGFRTLAYRTTLPSLISWVRSAEALAGLLSTAPSPDQLRHAALHETNPQTFNRAIGKLSRQKCDFGMFSDTIVLYLHDETKAAARQLITVAASMMGTFMGQGIALRGAVVRGPLYSSPAERLFVGRSLVRAYDLDKSQDWAGAILDPALVRWLGPTVRRLEHDGLVARYRVPMKRGIRSMRYVIGWPLGFIERGSDLFRRMQSTNPARGEARQKLKEAARYLDWYRQAQLHCENHRFLQAMAQVSGR